jgi:uncharacterized protein YjdB
MAALTFLRDLHRVLPMSIRTSRRRSVLAWLAPALLLPVLPACGGGDGPPTGGNPVTQVTVTAPQTALTVGQTVQAAATPRDAQGNAKTDAVAWSSSADGVATVSATGLVTAVAPGTASIRATAAGITGSVDVTVSQAPVATVVVTPEAATVELGQTRQLAAEPRGPTGTALTGRVVAWSTLDPAVAGVSATGLVQSLALGQARIVATVEGKADTAAITVIPVAVASVAVVPDAFQLQVGGTREIAATARDAGGNLLTGRPVAWTSLDPSIATVTAGGEVRGVAIGQARIVATVEGKADTANVGVHVPVAGRVEVTPRFAVANVGQGVQLTAAAFTPAGEPILAPTVTWSSTTGGLAVSTSGVVTGTAAGIHRAVAAVNDARDTVTIVAAGPTSLVSTAFAGGSIDATAKAGALVSVPLTLDLSRVSANGDLGALQVEIGFDAGVLALESFTAGARGALEVFSPAAGKVRVAFAETAPQGSANLTVVTLNFRVLANATVGARSTFTYAWQALTSTGFQPYSTPLSVGGTVRVIP